MNKLTQRALQSAIALVMVSTVLTVAALLHGNRDVSEVSAEAKQRSFQQAVSWLKSREPSVLADGNSALWWMVKTAADVSGDPYLGDLVKRSVAYYSGSGGTLASPWMRLVDPKIEVGMNVDDLDALLPYQRFFLHAVTCRPLELKSGDTQVYLTTNQCRPMAVRVFGLDPVCSTHQLMGLALAVRSKCATVAQVQPLSAELLDDIEQQMQWDVVVRDAYIQRVLALTWSGHADRVKPVWMQRVIAAQQPNGGWTGGRQFPELPLWAQPTPWRALMARLSPGKAGSEDLTDFHATAQGLLLAALAMRQGPGHAPLGSPEGTLLH